MFFLTQLLVPNSSEEISRVLILLLVKGAKSKYGLINQILLPRGAHETSVRAITFVSFVAGLVISITSPRALVYLSNKSGPPDLLLIVFISSCI